ncbi:ATP-binding protein [Magnetococcus sp. PR-3]|uniref:ATP-binding protein n=1 Tax=Magnetococcus sp. PR-3 TaxID=3120355 RepID=UPI002FCE554B
MAMDQQSTLSPQHLTKILEHAKDAIISANAEGEITYLNLAAEQMFGWPREAIMGQNVNILMPMPDSLHHQQFISRFLNHKDQRMSNTGREVTAMHKDGSRFPIEISLSVFEQDGHTTFTALIRDITQRKQREDQLLIAKQQAEVAVRAKREFLAMMSHEIRTPINAIMGMHELMLEEPLDPLSQDYLHSARQASKGLLAIVDDMLTLAGMTGYQDLEQPCHLHELIHEITDRHKPAMKEKGLCFTLNVAPTTPHRVLADASKVGRMVHALLDNAVKFTHQGKVEVFLAPAPYQGVELIIQDSGIGIDSAEQQAIFHPFHQVDGSFTRQQGGAGMGLAIVQRLVQQMQGHILVESQPGQGSRFTLTLPLSPLPSEEKQPTTTIPLEELPTRTILLAEDAEENIRLVKAYLTPLGHDLTVTYHGKQALEMVKQKRFDLILMDIQMPIMDGYEATRQIRQWEEEQKHPATPIVALTANALEEDAQNSLSSGCDAHFTKPITKVQLIHIINHYSREANTPQTA